jgi:arsenate reductase (glutaredoxin)
VIQIFGTRKCPDTRKAERYFSERRVKVQSIDLARKAPSPGELKNIASAVGGVFVLLDREAKRFADRGLKHAMLGDPDIERLLLEEPLLLKTPIVRDGKKATLGYVPDIWSGWLDAAH